jgi:hypothetical protein
MAIPPTPYISPIAVPGIIQFRTGSIIVNTTTPWRKLEVLGDHKYLVLDAELGIRRDIGNIFQTFIFKDSGWKIDESSTVELTLSRYE